MSLECGLRSQLSIGNDIVDLLEHEPALHPRFFERVFSRRELDAIGDSLPELWLYWAAKEAAYKTIKRIDATQIFSPLNFEFIKKRRLVGTPLGDILCRWDTSLDFVHVCSVNEATLLHSSRFKCWIRRNPNDQSGGILNPSAQIREFACSNIAEELGLNIQSLKITSEVSEPNSSWSSIPKLLIDGEQSPHRLSLSHHGRFLACSFLHEKNV